MAKVACGGRKMMIFAYTFLVVFVALVVILGLGSLLTKGGETPEIIPEGAAAAAIAAYFSLLRAISFLSSACLKS